MGGTKKYIKNEFIFKLLLKDSHDKIIINVNSSWY